MRELKHSTILEEKKKKLAFARAKVGIALEIQAAWFHSGGRAAVSPVCMGLGRDWQYAKRMAGRWPLSRQEGRSEAIKHSTIVQDSLAKVCRTSALLDAHTPCYRAARMSAADHTMSPSIQLLSLDGSVHISVFGVG